MARITTEKKDDNLALHFNNHFPVEPSLADFIAAKDSGSADSNWR